MRLDDFLGIKYPIIQGGMANISTYEFAAAVSNSGGLGVISTGGLDADTFRDSIVKCKTLTDKPFGVNILMLHPDVENLAKIAVEEKVSVVTTGAGNPAKFIEMWKNSGAKVLPVIPGASLAKRMESYGADAVIAEGTEAGGHIGDATTMTLLPQVVDAVNIPVIAAGGIANGRQLLAAFALGAVGAQLGTCLLVSEECPIHENYKLALIKSRDNGTVVSGRIAGVPVRGLKNAMMREYIKQEKQGKTSEELEHFTLGSLRKAVFDGDTVNGSLMAGQVAAQLTEIRPLATIFETIMSEYLDALANLK